MKVKIFIIMFNLLAIASLLILNHPESRTHEPLPYDTKLPPIEAEELAGGRISIDTALRGRYGILFYCHGDVLKLVRNGIPSRDELRQHVEKLLLGEIFYEPSIVARVGPTMELGTIEAADLDGGATVALRPGQGSIYVVFTAALCSSCNTEPYYDQLERLVDLVRRRTELRDRELRLLLSAGYPVAEVAFELGKRGLDLDVYRATGTLRGLEDDYFTKRRSEAGVLVVLFDSRGKVSFIEPIDKALEYMEQEEADHVV